METAKLEKKTEVRCSSIDADSQSEDTVDGDRRNWALMGAIVFFDQV